MSTDGSDRSDLVIFSVPLVSRALTDNWARVTHQFNATLGSLFQQTAPNFHVIAAGPDEPPIDVTVDRRFEFLRFPDPPKLEGYEKLRNQKAKHFAIARRARELGGGYLMHVDSDDLVSRDLVAFLQQHPHPHGYLAGEGYVFDALSGDIAPYPMVDFGPWTFDRVCGSSTILRLYPEELPADDRHSSVFGRIYEKGHHHVRQLSLDEGRPLADLPFRAVTYVRAGASTLAFNLGPDFPSLDFHHELIHQISRHAMKRTPGLDATFNLNAAMLSETP
jgi:hypothetical protein